MKKIMVGIGLIVVGVSFTFFVLNNKYTIAKENFSVYALETGVFENKEKALKFVKNLPSYIIVESDGLYKVYSAIYKNIDIINEMVVYLENKDILVYLKSIDVTKEFYNELLNYEKIITNNYNENIYDQVNQSILNTYIESQKYD